MSLATEDTHLPTLRRALDPGLASEAIRRALAGVRSSSLPDLARVELVKHRPGRRCVIRYVFGSDGGNADLVVIGKVRAKGVDRRVDRIARDLRARGFAEGGGKRFVVPEPLGVVPELALNLQRGYPGRSVSTLLSSDEIDSSRLFQIGASLGEVHRDGPLAERVHGVEHELSLLEREVARVAIGRSALASRIERLLDSARRAAAAVADRPHVAVHRDFHPDQILADGSSLVLLDLDLYAMGDPMLDVSNFVAHLREQALRERGRADEWEAHEKAFLAGYRSVRSGALDRGTLEAWLFLSLLRHVAIASRMPERRPYVDAIMALCESSEVHAKAN